jgi:ABC-type Fe3+ transport system permease subunit
MILGVLAYVLLHGIYMLFHNYHKLNEGEAVLLILSAIILFCVGLHYLVQWIKNELTSYYTTYGRWRAKQIAAGEPIFSLAAYDEYILKKRQSRLWYVAAQAIKGFYQKHCPVIDWY